MGKYILAETDVTLSQTKEYWKILIFFYSFIMDDNLKTAISFVAGCVTSYLVANIVVPKLSKAKKDTTGCCNYMIKKDEAKVVDTYDVEDISDKAVFCRCWKSKKFPMCDGSHNAHNKETGDNVGPLIVSKKSN